MTWDMGFTAINALVMPAWAMLIFLPKARITNTTVHSMLWPIILGSVYAVLLIAAVGFGLSDPEAGFSLKGVQALFDHPNGVLIGWSHYLVFDLFVGAWIGRDALRRGVPHWQTVPCLLGSYVFGPVGLLLYAIIRLLTGKGFALFEA